MHWDTVNTYVHAYTPTHPHSHTHTHLVSIELFSTYVSVKLYISICMYKHTLHTCACGCVHTFIIVHIERGTASFRISIYTHTHMYVCVGMCIWYISWLCLVPCYIDLHICVFVYTGHALMYIYNICICAYKRVFWRMVVFLLYIYIYILSVSVSVCLGRIDFGAVWIYTTKNIWQCASILCINERCLRVYIYTPRVYLCGQTHTHTPIHIIWDTYLNRI